MNPSSAAVQRARMRLWKHAERVADANGAAEPCRCVDEDLKPDEPNIQST